MRAIRQSALLLLITASAVLMPAQGWAQGGSESAQALCTPWTASATGRIQLSNFVQPSIWGVRTTYYTTGSPASVSITVEAGNEAISTKTPVTKFDAATNTRGADMGSALGTYKYWWINI